MFFEILLGLLQFTDIYNENMHGLASTFPVDCPFCGHKNNVSTSIKYRHGSSGPSAFDVNNRAALGALNAGIGHA